MNKKKSNGFEYSIFGIDLFIKYLIEKINKSNLNRKNKNNALFF